MRRILYRWLGWFALANAAVLAIVGLRYFSGFAPGGTVLSWIYLVTVFPAHHVLLAAVPAFIVLTPFILLLPSRRSTTAIAVLLFALMIAIITLDSLLWSQSRFHLNALTLQILGWQSWTFVAVLFVIGLIFESLLAGWVWRWVEGRPWRGGRMLTVGTILAIVTSQLVHAWADANYYVPVTSVGQQLPVYKGFTAKRQLTRLGLVDAEKSREREVARRLAKQLDEGSSQQVLNYPLQPLACANPQPPSVLLILADALRDDVLNGSVTPFLDQFATARAARFEQHFSGGNSSRMGMFSLFYGLPPGYWSSFESLQQATVLITQMQRQDYELGVFSSSTLYRPVALDRTVFATVSDLQLQTGPAEGHAWERDRSVTGEWIEWLNRREPGRPFFGFLLYDATNAQVYPPEYDDPAAAGKNPQTELERRFAAYKKAARFVDDEIARVIRDLESRGLMDRTIVIVTSDHGEEFGESSAGLRDHGSGYTSYQLRVPLLVHWPGRDPARFSHRTSHYDVVPTLLMDALGCSNPPGDYSSGRNLYAGQSWDWLLAGSYYNYAVLEPDQITITYPNGRFEVRDWDYRVVREPEIRGDVLQAVTRENSRFYRQ